METEGGWTLGTVWQTSNEGRWQVHSSWLVSEEGEPWAKWAVAWEQPHSNLIKKERLFPFDKETEAESERG